MTVRHALGSVRGGGVCTVYRNVIIGPADTARCIDNRPSVVYRVVPQLTAAESRSMPDTPTAEVRRPHRIRVHLAVTVHQDTVDRLEELCGRFASTRGRVIDRVIEVLHTAYTSGTVHCIHGQPCSINRKDLPQVF